MAIVLLTTSASGCLGDPVRDEPVLDDAEPSNPLGHALGCALSEEFEAPEGSVFDQGTDRAVYVIRRDGSPRPLLQGTSGRVELVGISVPDQRSATTNRVLEIDSVRLSQGNCWARGQLRALSAGTAHVMFSTGEQVLATDVEVAEPARLVIETSLESTDEGLVMMQGEQRTVTLSVRDAQGRKLAFLEQILWTVTSGVGVITLNDDLGRRSNSNFHASGPEATVVALGEGEGELVAQIGAHKGRLPITVRIPKPPEESAPGAGAPQNMTP